MFTGIVEEIGQLKSMAKNGQSLVLTIQAERILEDIHLGDSISVNGVCLTVTRFSSGDFTVDVMPETYRKTNLVKLSQGANVNLERAMPANGRFGGHIVQGHVDGVGMIKKRAAEQNAVVFHIELDDPALFRYLIPQGSITVDGISLTIVNTQSPQFTVSIIPHTLQQTVLRDKHAGDSVNIECDLLGKYVDHLLHSRQEDSNKTAAKLDVHYLSEHGFI